MTRYRFDQIAENSTAKKKPEDSDRERYVGLEHLDPGALEVTRWGAEVTPKGDKLLMERGDVLFGRRRAYQKKVGIAPFDGIFSAHGMVLRPRTDVVDPDFFPFFISSDVFLDEAIRVSVGSLSPTANWKDLRVLEFSLPTLDKQRELAGILSEAEQLKGCYRGLLATCDDIVKSQFVEMFGDEKWGFKPLSECVDSIDTGKSMNCGEGPRGVGGFGVLKLSALSSGTFVASENKVISKDNFMSIKEVEKGDLLFARKNTPELVGTTVYVPNEVKGLMFPDLVFRMKPKDVNALYLLAYMRSDRGLDLIQGMAHGSAKSMVNIPKTQLARLPVPVPPLELQQEFADFVAQVDKSKFAVQKALDELNATTKKILNQELGLGNV